MALAEITPGGWLDFCANVDGPWVRTDRDAFTVELDVLFGRLMAIGDLGDDRPADGYSASEQFTLGVKDVAAWTLGVSGKAPFRSGEMVVSDATVNRCVGDAELLIRLDTVVRWYAEGVRAWLRWLAGLDDRLAYTSG